MVFLDTPRMRRLISDQEAMKALRDQSSIVEFQAQGDPPERYPLRFGAAHEAPPLERDEVALGRIPLLLELDDRRLVAERLHRLLVGDQPTGPGSVEKCHVSGIEN